MFEIHVLTLQVHDVLLSERITELDRLFYLLYLLFKKAKVWLYFFSKRLDVRNIFLRLLKFLLAL